ncbi:hypothetical protein [Micromonospora sp. NBC_01638]|uniref:hypothetical protein n=1 Tax=Micromonospora sp. NBC_01638 TaxID=2975982 RepID=UPI00386D8D9A|nr:hypothetical protein OG811_22370 [Micromonospora sp. NBC_01638]
MRVPGWLNDTRTSDDTVAVSYAGLLRDALTSEPFQRASRHSSPSWCTLRETGRSPMPAAVRAG